MKRNIIAILASAVMLTVSGCSAHAVSGSDVEKPEKYELEPDVPIEHSFDPADHEWYGDISAKLADYADVIEIPEKLTRREVKWFLDKIHNDHPDIFWLQSYYSSTKSNTTKIDFVLPEDYTKEEEMKMHQELLDKVDEIVASIPEGSSDFDKAKFLHDYIAENCYYDHAALNDKDAVFCYTAYGCLVEGKAVCAGYTNAYSLLMRKAGIECGYSWGYPYAGDSHAWNYVKLDGDYYWVDVTWDDLDMEKKGGLVVNDTYFMITSEMMRRTRSLDREQNFAPECTATEYNYFRQNDAYFTEYDSDKVKKCLEASKDKGMCEMMFDNYDVYCKAVDELLAKKKIRKLAGFSMKNMQYMRDDRMFTLTFSFDT